LELEKNARREDENEQRGEKEGPPVLRKPLARESMPGGGTWDKRMKGGGFVVLTGAQSRWEKSN